MSEQIVSYQTFLGGGEVLGVRHLGSKLSVLLQKSERTKKIISAKSFPEWKLGASQEQQEILEVQAQGNKRTSCLLLDKWQ